jgi:hypothetical protein
MAGERPRTACGSLLQQLKVLHVPCQYMNFIVNNQEIFQANSSNKRITQGISTIFIDQIVTCLFFSKSTLYVIKISINLPPSLTIFKNDNVKFKRLLRKHLNTHSLYYFKELFYVKQKSTVLFCKLLVVFHTLRLYLCTFDPLHILLSL